MTPGTCSACGAAAEQNPVTGRWWHSRPACPNRSQTVFVVCVVEDGVMRTTTDAERPARFAAEAGIGQNRPLRGQGRPSTASGVRPDVQDDDNEPQGEV